jgi:mRNA-degrading endonuclease RelE of RelBE toxin-antitoxin system
MPAAFRILSTAAFDRSFKRLAKKHSDIPGVLEELVAILEADPLNTSRRHNIKKLVDVEPGDGQWRIRSGVYRLRYDVIGTTVTLHSINHRRDAY